MDATKRFAPISSERSGRLTFVIGYFALGGVIALVTLIVGLVRAAGGWDTPLREVFATHPVALLITAVMGGAQLWVAWQLSRRSRLAAAVAVLILLIPVAGWAMGFNVSGFGVIVNLVGVALVGTVWGELNAQERQE